MTRVCFTYYREFTSLAYCWWIIYSDNILKKTRICEIISGAVSHSHLLMLDPRQEAIYLILMGMMGIRCEFPDTGAPFFIYLFIFQSELFKHEPSEEFSQSSLENVCVIYLPSLQK